MSELQVGPTVTLPTTASPFVLNRPVSCPSYRVRKVVSSERWPDRRTPAK
jgi:hypothetical protein